MITQSIREEDEAPARRDRPVLETVSVRIPTKLKRRIDRAAFRKGIEKTQLVRHFFVVAAAVLLEQDDILDSQMTLFDPNLENG